MNGFTILAGAWQALAEKGEVDKDQADKHSRIYDFLATCDREDLSILYDSGAFNCFANTINDDY
jgi:hypothetical protein